MVVLIGGKGKRLRPLSSNARPKAFLSVTRDRLTMFQRSLRRARRIVPRSRVIAVGNGSHRRLVRRDAPSLGKTQAIFEPLSRNTAPAIALAAHALEKKGRDAVMVVLPTDQYLADEASYVRAVKRGIAFVTRTPGSIVLLGHTPTYPATGFGYIRVKGQGSRSKGIQKIEIFTEKPDEKTARRYVKSGKYLWNMGAFIFSVDTILAHLKRHAPRIYRGTRAAGRVTRASYSRLPDISIDYAVMERAKDLYCVPGDHGWQDMGGFDALRAVLRKEGRRFVERNGKVVEIV